MVFGHELLLRCDIFQQYFGAGGNWIRKDQLCTKFGQKKKFWGEGLLRVDWVSRIDLSKEREDQIRQCFNYAVVEIHYPDDVDDLNLIIETFQKETHDNVKNNNNNCNIFGGNKNLTSLLLWTGLRSCRQI